MLPKWKYYTWLSFSIVLLISFINIGHLTFAKKSTTKSANTGQQKAVKVLLNSKWTQTPLYLEVAEFLAEENQDYFWSYLDDLYKEIGDGRFQNLTQADEYDISLRLASKLLRSETKLDILKFSISLRSYSPTVTIFRQITSDIVSQNKHLKSCDSFVEFSYPLSENGGEVSIPDFKRYSCKFEDVKLSFKSLLSYVKSTSSPKLANPLLYSVDHLYPGIDRKGEANQVPITVILYGSVGSSSFLELHNFFKKESSFNPIKYVIRHFSNDQVKVQSNVALSGYGVELAIKSTEYKAQDDSRVRGEVVNPKNDVADQAESKPDEIAGFTFSKLKTKFPSLVEKLEDFQNYLIDSEKEIATLKVWELQEISLQAVTKILSVQKDEALSILKDISQNFPTVARSLVKISVDPELKKEIVKNQYLFMQNLNLGTSDTALFINGLYNDIDSVDVFTLFESVKQEFNTVSKLYSLLNGDNERIKKFIKLDVNWEKQDFQLDIRDGAVQYINDIESDSMYRSWPSGLHEMLRQAYPGMLRNVRRNMYHLVLVLDPSRKESFDVLRMAESFYIHKAPVRIGLVFAVNRDLEKTGYQDAGIACLEAFNYISQSKTPYEGLSFLTDVIANAGTSGFRDLEPHDVVNQFKSKINPSKDDLDDIFGADSAYDTGRKLAWDFIERTGLDMEKPKALMNGVILKDTYLNADYFEDAVLTEIMRQTTPLQKAIYKRELNDDDDILDWLMSKPTVMPRLNRVIFGMDSGTGDSARSSKFVDLSAGHSIKVTPGKAMNYHSANINDLQATFANTIKYINTKKDCNPITVWLASDFQSVASRKIVLNALTHLKSNSRQMRLALVFTEHNQITRIIDAALNSISNSQHLIQFMHKFVSQTLENHDQLTDEIVKQIFSLVPEEYRKQFNDRYESTNNSENEHFALHQAFCSRVLNLAGGGSSAENFALVLNGKVYKVSDGEPQSPTFIEQDFALMERFVSNLVSDKIVDLLNDKESSSGVRKCSDLVLKLSVALLSKQQTTKQRYDVTNVKEDHSVLLLEPRFSDQPFVELTVILDPLTRGAQKISPILDVFHRVFNARIKIYFNCVDKHSDMPLKLFYRFVLEKEPKFDTAGKLVAPIALFNALPKSPLLTLGMAVPENWLVEAVEAIYDLDNIHLEEVDSNAVSAVFELEHLLVEGHCFEQSTGSPPRGLQFTLGTQSNPVMVDTIVMANLGYFQLKANPGIWTLRLRQGRSDDIYTIVSHDGAEQVANTTEVIPVVSNFRSLVIKIRVNKKVGKQNEDLLYDSDSDNGSDDNSLWGSFSWNSGDKEKKASANQVEDEDSKRINIFSLASGHLYERLLRIMMTSVLKNTKTPVKFWFLKNYLSPNFKNVLPFMAKKYGFDYELVQYKWPRWLHQQTEKQRIIWGYKILFLDVLFPLDVKKIIFVDADQVVRADLKELRDLDLEGAPYGYTPFCDSRKDMDGFRFWKSGYWATHLHGRKYHISALYVVDLQKFRRIAAGDRLRGQYQGLSQDPNSLSNLDQDLPNNMIHQVAIKSLPQEWLWCETWCDDHSKKKAKTIDLCNNPKTKEPKLTSARRIIAEWEGYDLELKQMLDEFNSQSAQSPNANKVEKKKASIEENVILDGEATKVSHQEL